MQKKESGKLDPIENDPGYCIDCWPFRSDDRRVDFVFFFAVVMLLPVFILQGLIWCGEYVAGKFRRGGQE